MMKNRYLLLNLICVLSLAALSPLAAQDDASAIEVVGGDEQALREFIGRILSPMYAPPTKGEQQILIGSLPDNLPFDLPIPQDARVVGSMVLGDSIGTQVILSIPGTAEEVTSFYADALSGAGWRDVSQGTSGTGFVGTVAANRAFCDANDNYIMLTAIEPQSGEGGVMDVRLQTQSPAQFNQCTAQVQGSTQPNSPIPPLETPPGTTMRGGGSSGGSNGEWAVSADLRTDLDAEALATAYNEQLEGAGWSQVNTGSAEGSAWSTWTFADDQDAQWGGTLLVIESPTAPDARFAYLQVAPVQGE
jgi:hypothetical protein